MSLPAPASVVSAIDAAAPALVELRRALHRRPEPSWHEHHTTQIVVDALAAAGLAPRVAPTGTGVLCEIGSAGPLVALRADIDALRLPDLKDTPYRSEVDGVCHACGHDVHTAALVGAASALAETLAGSVEGRVRLIFQPAEESIPGGASALVEAGVMSEVSAIFALHCDPTLEVGRVGLSPGAITSAADRIEIHLRGAGGHTARPHRTTDLVYVAARVAAELPGALARLSDSRDGVNLTFGAIRAGDAPNVIPTDAWIRGSLRAGGRASWESAGPKLRRLLTAMVEPFGATFDLHHQVGAPPVVNDPWATAVMAEAVTATVAADAVVPTLQSGGGEDFSWYLDHAPGAYCRLGTRAPGGAVVDIHASAFDVDERCITLGATVLAATALAALGALHRR